MLGYLCKEGDVLARQLCFTKRQNVEYEKRNFIIKLRRGDENWRSVYEPNFFPPKSEHIPKSMFFRDVKPTYLPPMPLLSSILPMGGLTIPSGYTILMMLQVIRAVAIDY